MLRCWMMVGLLDDARGRARWGSRTDPLRPACALRFAHECEQMPLVSAAAAISAAVLSGGASVEAILRADWRGWIWSRWTRTRATNEPLFRAIISQRSTTWIAWACWLRG